MAIESQVVVKSLSFPNVSTKLGPFTTLEGAVSVGFEKILRVATNARTLDSLKHNP